MAISKELFLAILSLDSYSRGYGAAIDDGAGSDDGLGEAGHGVGSAEIKDVDIPNGSKDAGFYAVSYTVGSGVDGIADGTMVISYRGTDNFGKYYDADRGANDILNGWLGGSGSPTSQTSLALEFYESVTGHSPGGGLPLNPATAH